MEIGLDVAPAQSGRQGDGASERGLARPADCEALAGLPLSTLLYYVLTESLFLGPVSEMRRRPAAD
jgi:hypothetical protein